MTDEEWERADYKRSDLNPTLWWVLRTHRPSLRKQRLFACACCRRGWDLFPAEAWHAVGVAERFADYQARNPERAAAYKAVARLVRTHRVTGAARHAVAPMKDGYSATNDISQTASTVADAIVNAQMASAGASDDPVAARMALLNQEAAAQHRILACLFLNPESVFSSRLPAKTPEIQKLAETAYEERVLPLGQLDNVRLVVLADALEEVGAAPQVLAHLRRPEAHYRGCWALDLVLGREVPWPLLARESAVEPGNVEVE
jgi:hypothetical protein